MEEKKLNALPDEALDAVAGGAGYRYNEKTGKYDVYTKTGSWSNPSTGKRTP